jgi:hypothetical protein
MTSKKLAEDPSKQPNNRHKLKILQRCQGDVEDKLIHLIPTIINGIISRNGKQRTSVSRKANMDVSNNNLVKVDSSWPSKAIEPKAVIIGDS